MVPFVRSPYNYDAEQASDESGLRCEDVSLTVQAARDETDINTIVRRYGLTGTLPEVVRVPEFGDFTGVSDYQSALNAVMEADKAFGALPADLRAKFNNSPQVYLEFCSDEANRDEMRSLGLLKEPPVVPEPVPAPVPSPKP